MLLLLILILSLVILQVIYRPIQRIVESMLTGQETEAGQDEAGSSAPPWPGDSGRTSG